MRVVVAPTAASAEGTEAAVQVVVAAAAAVRCGVCVCMPVRVVSWWAGCERRAWSPPLGWSWAAAARAAAECAAAAAGARDRDHHPEEVARSQRGGAGERCMRVRKMRGRTRCAD